MKIGFFSGTKPELALASTNERERNSTETSKLGDKEKEVRGQKDKEGKEDL